MDLYAQRVDEFGRILWQPNGSPVSKAAGNQGIGPGTPTFVEFSIVNNEVGGAVFGWSDGRQFLCGYPQAPSNCKLYTQMLTGNYEMPPSDFFWPMFLPAITGGRP